MTTCIATLCVGEGYVQDTIRMLRSYLDHTPYVISLVTDQEVFQEVFVEEIYSGRLRVSGIVFDGEEFDFTLKLNAIEVAYRLGCDVVYWVDGDVYTTGWDLDSFNTLINSGLDVWVPSFIRPVSLSKGLDPWFDFGDCSNVPIGHFREDRVVFTNKVALGAMIDYWNKVIPSIDDTYRSRYGIDGKLMALGIVETNQTCGVVSRDCAFTKYEFIDGTPILDRWGCRID